MAFNYVRARATAKRLIENFGGAGSVVELGIIPGGYNDDGSINTGTPDVVIDGIITPWLRAKNFEIDGEHIEAGDGFVYFHSDTPAVIGMQTTLNSITYRIVDTRQLSSVNDVKVYLRLQLRV